MPITRLNHAVLFVRDADAAADFYRSAFGFEELTRPEGMRAVFMRSPSGGNHHDLGLFEVGAQAPQAATRLGRALPPRLADRHDRGARRDVATPAGARGADRRVRPRRLQVALWPGPGRQRVRGHVAGPPEAWGEFADQATIMPLDLDAEVRRWGADAAVQ